MKPEAVATLRLAPHGLFDLREEAEKNHGLDAGNAHLAATAVADLRRRIYEGIENPDTLANAKAAYTVTLRQVFSDNMEGVTAEQIIELAEWGAQRALIPDED